MPKKIDLTGKRFGRLVVAKETPERKHTEVIWECKCDCGNILKVKGGNLKSGHTQSCGCAKKPNLIGEKYGRLTVVAESNRDVKNNSIRWLCKCSCGNETITTTGRLQNGNTKSCGCLKSESSSERFFKNLVGIRFGRLIAIKPLEEKTYQNGYIWNCKCDCGKAVNVTSASLMGGNTNSCGCLNAEMIKSRLLDRQDIVLVEGTSLDMIRKKKQRNNTSGVKGVSWDKQTFKWVAYIYFQGERHRLGFYDNIEDAAKARKAGEEKYFTPILEKYGRITR